MAAGLACRCALSHIPFPYVPAQTAAGYRRPDGRRPGGKSRLQIGQADIAPSAGVDHDGMRALVIGTVNNEPGRAGLAHFPEGDFLFGWRACNSAKKSATLD